MQFTEGHQFVLNLAEIIAGCLVKLGATLALYHSSPRKKDE